jgi:hypothetical protein
LDTACRERNAGAAGRRAGLKSSQAMLQAITGGDAQPQDALHTAWLHSGDASCLTGEQALCVFDVDKRLEC